MDARVWQKGFPKSIFLWLKIEIEKAKNNREKILPEIKKVIKDYDLTMKVSSLLATAAK